MDLFGNSIKNPTVSGNRERIRGNPQYPHFIISKPLPKQMKPRHLNTWLPACLWLALLPIAHAVELDYSTRENTIAWFEGARFGVFIHWDVRSNGKRIHKNSDIDLDVRPCAKRMQSMAMWGDPKAKSAKKPWESWNPSKFDADKWMETVASSGARYFAFTTMHSQCLSNFDHPTTRFDIMSTPFGRDVVAELAMAAKRRGIVAIWYFNMFPSKHIAGNKAREKYFWSFAQGDLAKTRNWEDFRRDGLLTLLTHPEKYGKVAGVWCDGGGTFTPKGAKGFYEAILEKQPWLIFSPRHGHPTMPKDYRITEQRLPSLNWSKQMEMVMPVESDLWFWTLGKKANTKDAEFVIQTLVITATRDANLMVNISPRGDGVIDKTQADVLRGVGKWLKVHGESIFETRAGPYAPGSWGGSTRAGKKVYLHFTQLSQDGTYQLPGLPAKIVSAKLLDGGGKVAVKQSPNQVLVTLDKNLAWNQNVIDRVVVLELDKDAWDMLPAAVIPARGKEKPLAATATASSENTYDRPSGKPITDHASAVLTPEGGHGGWTASEPWSKAGLDPNPWLMLDFGKTKTVGRFYLEESHSRIQEFVVEAKNPESGDWSEILSGKRLNHLNCKLAKPLRTRFVRIRFPKVEGGAPQISSFHCWSR
jgi:alpha-L-fucosidase